MSTIALDPGEKLAKVNGLSLCYQTFGDPAAAPLLLVMGLGAQMIVWDDAFCEILAGRGFWVVRFDNRDVGKSTKIDAAFLGPKAGAGPAPYLLRDMATDAIGLLDVLGIAKAHIVGASMGGMIAQEIAIRWPERVRTLTSIMSTTGEPGLPPPRPEAMGVFTAPPPRDAAEYVEANVRAWNVFRGFADEAEAQRDRARAIRAAARGFYPEGGARQMMAVFASGSRRAALADVKVPTLVIHGSTDPLVSPEGGIDTARAIPGAKLVIIEGMGHAMPRRDWPRIIEEIVAITHRG